MIEPVASPNFVALSGSDPEMARDALANIFPSVRYDYLDQNTCFQHSLRLARVDDIYIWQSFSSTGFELTTKTSCSSNFELHFVEKGHCLSRIGKEVISAEAGDAYLLHDIDDHVIACQPETERVCVVIPSSRYSQLVAREFGEHILDISTIRKTAQFSQPGIARLRQVAKLLLSICGSEPTCEFPSIAANLMTEAFLALFVESWAGDSDYRHRQSARPFYVKRAVDWMYAHAAQKVTMDELAALSGVSVRTLQLGFRNSYGSSPMSYLLKIRLECAYKELLSEPAMVTIDEIARRWGFSNPGKFSAHIRNRYGRNPFEIRSAIRRAENEN